MITLVTYGIYLAVTLGITYWVAGTLHRNGRTFLVDAFKQNEVLADSVNHLLVVGFYLVNFGYVALALRMSTRPVDAETAVELLSGKLGLVLLVLGAMHFFNIYLFSRFRKSALIDHLLPPVAPDRRLTPSK